MGKCEDNHNEKLRTQEANAIGKTVIKWIQSHENCSWPSADIYTLNKMVQLILRWNYNKPAECSVIKWLWIQIQRYLDFNPQAKGKEIKGWIFEQNPNPQQDVSIHSLNRIVKRLQDQDDCRQSVSGLKSMLYWDYNRPSECSLLQQRRTQVKKFLNKKPGAKAAVVNAWIHGHKPDPWPDVNVRSLIKMLARLRELQEKIEENSDQSISQDYNKPTHVSISKQRHNQLKKYLEQKPGCKGSDVKKQLVSLKPDPWPEAKTRGLNRMLGRINEVSDNKEEESYSDSQTESVELVWDYAKPSTCSDKIWRRVQVKKYLQRFS